MSAWQCAAAAVTYYRGTNLDHPEAAKCVQGDCFFGEKVTTASGDFICNTSNGLYVPLQDPSTKAWNFKELTWLCVSSGGVQCRNSAEMSDKSEAIVQPGARISALPAPGKPGWLLEAASKKYLPMNHPSTGDVLFNKVDLEPGAASNVQQTTYTCLSQGGVQCRRSPDLSDKADMVIQHGQQIKGQQSAPGWIQDSASGLYVPMTHPTTGDQLFAKVEGNAQVVAAPKPVVMGNQTIMVSSTPPPNVPPGSQLVVEKYIGNTTIILTVVLLCFCGCFGLIPLCVGCDERPVWLAPDGSRYDLNGGRII